MKRWCRFLAALAGGCAAACTGALFQSKTAPPIVYVLSLSAAPAAAGPTPAAASAESTAAASAAASIPVDLAVLKPSLSPGLETDRIAVLYPDRHLDYLAGARWSGPLGELLQDAAVREFHAHAHLRTISGDASAFASAYWLELEVWDFQAEYTAAAAAPTVHVHFQARIGNSGDRHIVGRFAADVTQAATENGLSAIVEAYARASEAAFAQVIAQARDTLANASASP